MPLALTRRAPPQPAGGRRTYGGPLPLPLVAVLRPVAALATMLLFNVTGMPSATGKYISIMEDAGHDVSRPSPRGAPAGRGTRRATNRRWRPSRGDWKATANGEPAKVCRHRYHCRPNIWLTKRLEASSLRWPP